MVRLDSGLRRKDEGVRKDGEVPERRGGRQDDVMGAGMKRGGRQDDVMGAGMKWGRPE